VTADAAPDADPDADVIVVGGGTAGAVIAARLSEDPRRRVVLVEWGPDDRSEPRALQMRRWFEMLEGEYDLDYRSVDQPRGNSRIRQARARILGGCSSHNTMIALRPPDADFDDWAARGAAGWNAAAMAPYFDRLATPIQPVAAQHRNPYLADVVAAAASALNIPVHDDFNAVAYRDGTGFLPIGYTPSTGIRSSSSVSYLHPVMDERENLEIVLGARVLRVLFDSDSDSDGDGDGDGAATGVELRRDDGSRQTLTAAAEVVLCAGAIDTPRLLLLSGIGPAAQLREHGIAVVADVPGVGEDLTDHPEGLVVWEPSRPIPPVSATDWDVTIMARLDPGAEVADVLAHVPLMTYAVHAESFGLTLPEHSISMTPNVTRPRSRGRVALGSPDPDAPPLIDYRYFTDPDGHDERALLAGMRMARRIAATEPMAGWVARELFPGHGVVGDDELSAIARATHHTVYHVSCTCRMGAGDDPLAVLDSQLRVRGVRRLTVADASAFPSLTTVNPMVAVLMLAERAAEMLAARC
jgi:choline dehydrogenase-like flavoprotein